MCSLLVHVTWAVAQVAELKMLANDQHTKKGLLKKTVSYNHIICY